MKERLKRLLPKNKFARAVSVLAGGTAAGQIIVVVASPLLTRLYSPEDFGLLAVYAGLLGILGVVASLRYELAIPLPESNEEAASVAVLSLLTVLGMTLLCAVVVGIWGQDITALLNTPALTPYLWLLPLGLLLAGAYQALSYSALRVRAFSTIAQTKLIQATCMVGVQLVAYGFGPVALIFGRVIGQSAGITSLTRVSTKTADGVFARKKVSELYRVAVAYRRYPLISTWTGLSSAGGTHLPPLLIAALLGAPQAGLFALTHRVLSQPMAVLGKSIGDVFYREAAEAHREGRLQEIVAKVYGSLVAVSLPIALTIFLSAPSGFTFVFGEEWAVAGEMARWMTPWLFFQFVATPPTRVYPILDRHGIALRFQLSLLISGALSVVVASILFDSALVAVALMSLLNGGIYMTRLAVTYSLVDLPPSAPFAKLAKAFVPAVLLNLPLIGLWLLTGSVSLSGYIGVLLFAVTTVLVGGYMIVSMKTVSVGGISASSIGGQVHE